MPLPQCRSGRTLAYLTACLMAMLWPGLAAAQPGESPRSTNDIAIRQCLDTVISDPRRATELAQELIDNDELTADQRIRSLVCMAASRSMQGERQATIDTSMQALALLEAERDHLPPENLPSHHYAIAHNLLVVDEWAMALAISEQAYDQAVISDNVLAQSEALMQMGHVQVNYFDDPEGAEANIRRAIGLAESVQRPHPSLFYTLGYVLLLMERYDEALTAYDNALALIRRAPPGVPTPHALELRIDAHRARILHAHGQTDNAIGQLQVAIDNQHELPDLAGEAFSRTLLAEILLDQGDNEGALALAENAAELARHGASSREQRDALLLQARALAALGRVEDAMAIMRQAHEHEAGILREQSKRGFSHLQERLRQSEAQLQAQRAENVTRLVLAGALLLLLLGAGIATMQARTNRHLRHISNIDPLTGLFNRRAAAQRLSHDLAHGGDGGAPPRCVLLVIDIDHFKRVNDLVGHQAGDAILRMAAARLKACCQPADIVARWGGEEFLVVRTGTDLSAAQAMAETIRRTIAAKPFELETGEALNISVSIGFVSTPFFPGEDVEPWQACLPLADQALYAAKHAGRNAWIGIWGLPAGNGTPLNIIRRSTDRAQLRGWIEIVASNGLDLASVSIPDSEIDSRVSRSLRDSAIS